MSDGKCQRWRGGEAGRHGQSTSRGFLLRSLSPPAAFNAPLFLPPTSCPRAGDLPLNVHERAHARAHARMRIRIPTPPPSACSPVWLCVLVPEITQVCRKKEREKQLTDLSLSLYPNYPISPLLVSRRKCTEGCRHEKLRLGKGGMHYKSYIYFTLI